MSLAVGLYSSSKNKMGFEDKSKETGVSGEAIPKTPNEENVNEPSGGLSRHMSENSICATEDEEDDEERKIELGPQYTLKEQFEKDKVCFVLFFCSFLLFVFSFSELYFFCN